MNAEAQQQDNVTPFPVAGRAAIIAALNKVMEAVPYIQKTGKNEFHKYAYASEADLLAKLRPAMIEHGLVLIPSVVAAQVTEVHTTKSGAQNYRADVTLEMTLGHVSGECWPPIPWRASGIDTEDKMIAKAITSGEKYFLLKLFMVETGTDPDADGGEQGPRKSKGKSAAALSAPPSSPNGGAASDGQKPSNPIVTRLKQRIEESLAAGGAPALRDWWEQHKDAIKGTCTKKDGTFHASLWTACCMAIKDGLASVGDLKDGEKVD